MSRAKPSGQLEVLGAEKPTPAPRVKVPTITGWVRLAASIRDRVLLNLEGDAANLATSTAEGVSAGYSMAALALRLFRKSKPDEPIQLLASDTGEVMALACPHCRNVASQGHLYGGYKPNDPKRRPSIGTLDGCCRCQCGVIVGPGIMRECESCAAKEKPVREAAQAEHARLEEDDVARVDAWLRGEILRWGVPCNPEYPLSVVSLRTGPAFAAFPLSWEDLPDELDDRLEIFDWLDAHDAAPWGRGSTPEEALADLRARVAVIQQEAESAVKGG